MGIEKILENKSKNKTGSVPRLFDLSKTAERQKLAKFIKTKKNVLVVDDYKDQLKEYFQIINPRLAFSLDFETIFKDYLKKTAGQKSLAFHGKWVYYPWNSSLVHILPEAMFFSVRTARNQNLITLNEQKKFYNAVVGVAGLSVGNSAALAVILQGGSRHIKLADPDRLALSNTNRIRTTITNLGLPKVEMTARQIYELNPYAKVEIFPQGLNEKNITGFCKGLDVIVDEVDNLAIKYLLRVEAKKNKLPLVMAADNGDNGIVDVERYDINPKTKFFHGRLGKVSYQGLKNLNKFQTGRLITKHLGLKNVTPNMLASLTQIGKTLVSWPQLGGAALLNGSAVAFCVRKIANGQPLIANRAVISLEQNLQANYFSKKQKQLKSKSIKQFKKIFNL